MFSQFVKASTQKNCKEEYKDFWVMAPLGDLFSTHAQAESHARSGEQVFAVSVETVAQIYALEHAEFMFDVKDGIAGAAVFDLELPDFD